MSIISQILKNNGNKQTTQLLFKISNLNVDVVSFKIDCQKTIIFLCTNFVLIREYSPKKRRKVKQNIVYNFFKIEGN